MDAQHFIAAVKALSDASSSQEERKRAESWLISFKTKCDCGSGSDDGWSTAMQLLLGNHAKDVKLFAAQALKAKARLQMAASFETRQRMQSELLTLLHALPNLELQPTRQVVLALAPLVLATLDCLPQLISQASQALPLHTSLLILETLAEEGACLAPFGPGSMEERGQALLAVKAQLRAHSPMVFAWLAQVASQQPLPQSTAPVEQLLSSPPASQRTAGEQAAGLTAAKLFACFNAWIKLGGLHELGMGDSQALVNLALSHCQDLGSAALGAACEAMAEVIDHCPREWLSALHTSLIRLADLAAAAAAAGQGSTAEALIKVFAPYASLTVNPGAAATSAPISARTQAALLKLSLLPQTAAEGQGSCGEGQGQGSARGEEDAGDPVCWPALHAWTTLADMQLGMDFGEYGYFDDAEFYQNQGPGQGAAAAHGMHEEQEEEQQQGEQQGGGHAGLQQAGGFVTAGQMSAHQEAAAGGLDPAMVSLYEQLYVGLLNNLVAWGMPRPGSGQTGGSRLDAFTPTFMGALADCLVAICMVISPPRYSGLLQMMMEQQLANQQQQQQQHGGEPQVAAAVAAAACHAVSAAGGARLASSLESRRSTAFIMLHAACQGGGAGDQQQQQQRQGARQAAGTSDAHLVAFCCAAASTGRSTLLQLGESSSQAHAFLAAAFTKALAGLAHEDDTLDVRTPAALALKGLMTGALEAGCTVPRHCTQALVQALVQLSSHDAAAEQALVQALAAAVSSTAGGQAMQQQAELEVLNALTTPLHSSLLALTHQLQVGSMRWADIKATYDEALAGHFRRYSLVLQHALQRSRPPPSLPPSSAVSPAQGPGTPTTPAAANGVGGGPGTQWAGGSGSGDAQGTAAGAAAATAMAAAAQDSLGWLAGAFLQQLWPLVPQLVLGYGAVGEWVLPWSRCVNTLMALKVPGLNPVLPQLLEVLVACVLKAEQGGKQAAEPLALALELLSNQLQALSMLQHAVDVLLADPALARLAELRVADSAPELAEAALKVVSAYVRHTALPVAAQAPDLACTSLTRAAQFAAACCCANHKGVAVAALHCVSGLVATAATQPSCQGTQRACATVGQQAGVLTSGLLGTLLSVAPLTRVQRASAILTSIAALAVTAHAPVSRDPSHGAETLKTWLAGAAAVFQLPSAEVHGLASSWSEALLKALPGGSGGDERQQEVAARRVKKLLREFAELHSRSQ